MFAMKLSSEQRLNKAVVDIMSHQKYIALAGVMMVGSRCVDASVPTACTNGRDERYGTDFIDTLNDKELRFVVIHECYHKLYRHLTTWKHLQKMNAQLTNIACDYVINCKIVDDNRDGFAEMPRNPDGSIMGCFDEKYRGWDAAQVFWSLYKEQKDEKSDGKSQGDGADSDGNGGSGSGDTDDNQGNEQFDEHDWDGAGELTEQEANALAQEIDEAIRQGALTAGKAGHGDEAQKFNDLMQPQVNWKEQLREFVSTTCVGKDMSTWRRPNRRFMSQGYYMPSSISESIGELVIAIDTSGSIGSNELSVFMSEVRGLCELTKPERVRVLYWDTQIASEEVYETHDLDQLTATTKPKGGGGTCVECVPKYMKETGINAQACIVLTDGHLYAGWGTWTLPVLWVVLDNDRATPTYGKALHVKSGHLI